MMGEKTLMAQIEEGTAKIRGDKGVLEKLASTLAVFEMGFEIMPGTKARGTQVAKADPYEAIPGKAIAE